MKADSLIINKLPEFLVQDWTKLYMYSEFDMQVICYHWLRKHYQWRIGREWIVRTQPVLALGDSVKVKPDIVIYHGAKPIYAFELKCYFSQPNMIAIEKDQDKLRRLKVHGIRHAYQLVVYIDDGLLTLPSHRKDEWMKNYFSFIGINLKRHSIGRLRANFTRNYKLWKKRKDSANKRINSNDHP